jgi:hypothetical protein
VRGIVDSSVFGVICDDRTANFTREYQRVYLADGGRGFDRGHAGGGATDIR